jgi:dipeptidase E
MTRVHDPRRLLLISNSTLCGRSYLDHVADEIRDFLGTASHVIFVPFAVYDRHVYTAKARERFRRIGIDLTSVHDVSNMPQAIEDSLLDPIRRRVAVGAPYIGSSAGSIVACPTLKTTKDMPVVQPLSFEALGLVRFQISPHYLDPDPSSTHMGETQEERIAQFLEENLEPVVGLREGSFLRVQDGAVTLKGPHTARVFRRGMGPLEAAPDTDLRGILEDRVSRAGRVA